jgi:hypothetical protein
MNRNPIYATNATLDGSPMIQTPAADAEPSVIRPPIRAAYDTQQKYDQAVQIGIEFAQQKNLPYINHY